MRELSAGVRVIAIGRCGSDTLEHPPRRDTRFAAGDDAYLAGPYEELLRVLRLERFGGTSGDGDTERPSAERRSTPPAGE